MGGARFVVTWRCAIQPEAVHAEPQRGSGFQPAVIIGDQSERFTRRRGGRGEEMSVQWRGTLCRDLGTRVAQWNRTFSREVAKGAKGERGSGFQPAVII